MTRAKARAKQARIAAGQTQHPGKQARSAEESERPRKAPVSLDIEHDDAYQRKPVWRFGDLDTGAPDGFAKLTLADYADLHAKLGEFEKLTCREIWSDPKIGKRYLVEDAHGNITDRLTKLDRDDETALHVLRLSGPFRVYGVLRKHVFYVLWLDRDHEMWPSKLKNT